MKYLLMIIGYGWALWGAYGILMISIAAYNIPPHPDVSDEMISGIGLLVLTVNMLFFILPGLLVGSAGQRMEQ